MEIKEKDIVLLTGVNYNTNFYRVLAFDKQYPAEVTLIAGGYIYLKILKMDSDNGANNNFNTLINEDIFKIITKEEADAIINKLNEEFNKKRNDFIEGLSKPYIAINNRSYESIDSRNILYTGTNFIKQYSQGAFKDSLEINNGYLITTRCNVECASFMKDCSDSAIYIPKLWMNYYGYSLRNLKTYIQFLKDCGIGFDAEYTRTTTLKEIFPGDIDTYISIDPAGGSNSTTIIKDDMEVYEVILRGNDKPMVTYLHFVLLRLMYNQFYWNIPATVLKLKKNMPEATNWQLMLLTNMSYYYYYYYGLLNLNDSVSINFKDNTQELIFSRLAGYSGLNSSFVTFTHPNGSEVRNEIKNWIESNDYEKLQNYINEN